MCRLTKAMRKAINIIKSKCWWGAGRATGGAAREERGRGCGGQGGCRDAGHARQVRFHLPQLQAGAPCVRVLAFCPFVLFSFFPVPLSQPGGCCRARRQIGLLCPSLVSLAVSSAHVKYASIPLNSKLVRPGSVFWPFVLVSCCPAPCMLSHIENCSGRCWRVPLSQVWCLWLSLQLMASAPSPPSPLSWCALGLCSARGNKTRQESHQFQPARLMRCGLILIRSRLAHA